MQPEASLCIHELTPASCAVCTGTDNRELPQPAPPVPGFRATYPGRCAHCGTGIEPGDLIRADGDGGYLCNACGDEAEGIVLFG